MVWIPGSNNGEWGLNASRGALFPATIGLNGPFGSPGYPLPVNLQLPTGVVDRPYLGRAFGKKFEKRFRKRFGTVYELTPGGVTTQASWGFTDRTRRFSRSKKSQKKHRCEGLTNNNKRCKHKTDGKFCKCHLKQSRKRRRSIRS
jgi:hypothetical protein